MSPQLSPSSCDDRTAGTLRLRIERTCRRVEPPGRLRCLLSEESKIELLLHPTSSSGHFGPELWNADRRSDTRKQPTHDDARVCGIAGCLSENAFDAFTCLFPASKAVILG